MRELLASNDGRAKLAVDYFVYRAAKEIGALTACLGGLNGIIFTAGIGERAAEIRKRICESCRWLGVEIDDDAKPDLLQRYLKRWYWEVKGHVAGLTPDSTDHELRAAAPSIPVFELTSV